MGWFSSTESPVPERVTGNLAYVTSSTGRTVPLADVVFDTKTQKFTYYGADVTPFLSPFQKGAFASYDPSGANLEAYSQRNDELGRALNPGGSQNWLALGVENVAQAIDPQNPNSTASMIRKLVTGLLIIGGLWIGWQIVKAWEGK